MNYDKIRDQLDHEVYIVSQRKSISCLFRKIFWIAFPCVEEAYSFILKLFVREWVPSCGTNVKNAVLVEKCYRVALIWARRQKLFFPGKWKYQSPRMNWRTSAESLECLWWCCKNPATKSLERTEGYQTPFWMLKRSFCSLLLCLFVAIKIIDHENMWNNIYCSST